MSDAAASHDAHRGEKGKAFTGIWAGKGYMMLTKLFGFTRTFYMRALGDVPVEGDVTVLDLGCGPGVLGFALAKRMTPGSALYGVDLSEDQIRYAQEHAADAGPAMRFSVGSMDDLAFPDGTFELVVTSMAMHEASPAVRPKAIREVARVLKPGGRFLLVDWSRPKFGLLGLIWLPLLLPGVNKGNADNWNNRYREYCRENGMELLEDRYINSLARRQLFRKTVTGA